MKLSTTHCWNEFKQRNRAAIMWFFLGLPAAILLAWLLKYSIPLELHHALFGVAVLWGAVFAWLGVRVSKLRCPRCGKLFYGDGELDERGSIERNSASLGMLVFFGRCCKYCGLKLYDAARPE